MLIAAFLENGKMCCSIYQIQHHLNYETLVFLTA